MIPVLYSQDERDYGHNGIGILSDVMYYTVTEEANGEFELYLEYPVNGRLFQELQYQRLIKAKPNDLDADHVFRIYEIVKDLESHMVYIYATSKTNDLGTNLVKTLNVQNKTAQEALNLLKTNLVEPTEFNFVSDITTRSSTYWEFRNPLSCIVGEDNSLVKYWGGEVKRTNDTVYLYARRGRDNVTVLREGKNVKGLEFTVSTKGLVTKIVPYFIRYDEETGEEIITIGNTVSSPLVNNYPIVNVMPVDYTLWDELETAADLNSAASGYFTYQNPGVDKPKVSLDIDIMQLSESSQYKQYSNLESLIVFDSVTVYLPKFDVNVEVKVNRIVYNGLLERADTINCGDPISSLFEDVRRDYTELIGSTESKLINIVQKAGEGSSTIFRGPDEPVKGMKPGDLWYKPIGGSDKEMYQWTGAYWELILSTKDINANKELVDDAVAMAEQAKQAAEQSYLDSVAEAERLVGEQTEAFDAEMTLRKGEILEAKEQADLAVGKANSNAESIFGKLDLSVYEANKTAVETELGKKLATATYNAQKQTQDAIIAGKVAITTYNAKVSELNSAISGTSLRVDELEDGFALTATKTEVDSLKTRMNTAELSITATSNQLALKASQTDLNAATGRLTTAEGRITANATAIELRATKTDVNALTGRVTTAEGTITAQAGQIALRATTSTVNALTSRVSAAEASLVVQSGKIDLAATKSELTTAIDDIEIGGRNLIPDSNFDSGRSHGWHALAYYTESIVDGMAEYRCIASHPATRLEKIFKGLEGGQRYTLTIYAQIPVIGQWRGFVGATPTYDTFITPTTDRFMKHSVTFDTTGSGTTSDVTVRLYTPDAPVGTKIYMDWYKLEKGNKATDWTPAPEDVDAAISTVQSNLTVEAGKITSLTTRVGTAESKITSVTQTVSGINTTISTLRTDVNGKATIVALNQVKSTADGNKTTISNHSGRLTTVETTVSGLQTTVASKASQTQVTQLDTSLTSVVESSPLYFRVITMNYNQGGGGYPSAGGIYDVTRNVTLTGTPIENDRNYMLVIVNYAGAVVHKKTYDVYSSATEATALISAINFYDSTHMVIVAGTHAADTGRARIRDVLLATGASEAALDKTAARSGYILVGRKGLGAGNGYEAWASTANKGYLNLLIPYKNGSTPLLGDSIVYNSQITQLSTDINLRVTKGGLMSEINVQAGRTIISTGKLYLDTGSTTMTTAFVNDLNAKTLTAITANITSIRSKVLVTDSVTSTHVKAENALIDTIFGTTALITRLTSKTAFISNIQAINISADKITTGTLNATNVNIINLNVSKLVGDTANFVKTAWNGVNTSVSLDSTGLRSTSSRQETRLSAGKISFYVDNSDRGSITPLINTSDATRHGIAMVAAVGSELVLGRYASGGGVIGVLEFPKDKSEILAKGPIKYMASNEEVGSIYGHSTSGLIINSPSSEIQVWQGGTSVMYAVTGGLRMYRQINMNQNPIDNVTSLFAAEVATPILRKVNTLATDSLLKFTRAGVTYSEMLAGGFRMHIQINMNTYDITGVGKLNYASDARYKSSIVTREVSDLDIIRNIRYVDYTFNRDGSRQRGLIAQELMNADSKLVSTSEDGYLSYDSQQYTHTIGHGLQELDGNVRDLRDGVLRTNADFLSEIAELKNKIQQLEEKLE